MSWAAYPRYELGADWLGLQPQHWSTNRFSREIFIAEGQVDPEDERYSGMILIGPSHVESGTGRLVLEETAADQAAESGKYLCERGDVIYSKIRPALAKATLATFDCLCSADMYPLRAKPRVHAPYLLWLVLSRPFTAWSLLESERVAMPKINRETLSSLSLPLPPLDEQRAIANFLDAQTAKIDALVAKKRTLIEKLAEKRSALISHAVTRGIGSSPRSADSDAPRWELAIPEGWVVRGIKRVVRSIEQGWSPQCEDTPPSIDEWGVLKAGCCNEGRFQPIESKLLPEQFDPPRSLEIKPGDVLMSRASGSEELIGSVARVPAGTRPRLLLSDKIYRLHVDGAKIDADFLVYALRSRVGRTQIESAVSGASGLAKNVAQAEVREFSIPLPPLPEQRTIADFLDREAAKIDALVEKVEAAIERLQDYRAALVTAAVTGKIDVRGLNSDAVSTAVEPVATPQP